MLTDNDMSGAFLPTANRAGMAHTEILSKQATEGADKYEEQLYGEI